MEDIDNQRDTVYLSLMCRILNSINHIIENFPPQHTIYMLKSITTYRLGVIED